MNRHVYPWPAHLCFFGAGIPRSLFSETILQLCYRISNSGHLTNHTTIKKSRRRFHSNDGLKLALIVYSGLQHILLILDQTPAFNDLYPISQTNIYLITLWPKAILPCSKKRFGFLFSYPVCTLHYNRIGHPIYSWSFRKGS